MLLPKFLLRDTAQLLDRLPRRKLGWLAAFVTVLICFCATPRNLLFGCLASEEGSTYLRYARSAGLWRAILAPHQGYLALVPNVVAVVGGRFLPLIAAPWLAVYSALAGRVVVAWTCVTCDALRSGTLRMLACVLMATISGSATSLGTIHSQFYLGIAVALILVSDPSRYRWPRLAIVIVAGLTGPVSCMLAPLFMYRAWKERSKPVLTQGLMLTGCTVLQLVLVKITLRHTARRQLDMQSPWTYAASVYNHVLVLPFATRLVHHPIAGALPMMPLSASIVFCCVMSCAAVLLAWLLVRAASTTRMLATACILSAGVSVLGMIGKDIIGGGDRYFIVGNACLGLALITTYQVSRYRRTCLALISLMILSGSLDLLHFRNEYQTPLHWREQIQAWRNDPKHPFFNGPFYWVHTRYTLPAQPETRALPFDAYDNNPHDE